MYSNQTKNSSLINILVFYHRSNRMKLFLLFENTHSQRTGKCSLSEKFMKIVPENGQELLNIFRLLTIQPTLIFKTAHSQAILHPVFITSESFKKIFQTRQSILLSLATPLHPHKNNTQYLANNTLLPPICK